MVHLCHLMGQVRGRRSALLQVEVQTTRFCMDSVEVCPSVTNMSPSNIPDSWHSARPLLVLATVDINADCACDKAMDPDMALSSNSSPDDTMAPGDSAGHSSWHGLQATQLQYTNIVLDSRHPCVLWWQQEPLDINTNSICGKNMDPDIVLNSSLGTDVPTVQVGGQATQIGTTPVAVQLSDTSMAPGGGPGYRPLLVPLW